MGGRGSGSKGRRYYAGGTPKAPPRRAADTQKKSGTYLDSSGAIHVDENAMHSMSDNAFYKDYVGQFDDLSPSNAAIMRRVQLSGQGLSYSATQALVDDVGWNGKPTVMDDASFDAMVKSQKLSKEVIHRGVHTKASRDNTVYGDKAYMGAGVYGDGLYFSNRRGTASSYAGGKSNGSNKITAVLDKSRVKSISYTALENELRGKRFWLSLTENDISCYAIKKGYNVITTAGYKKNEKFTIVLDRSLLIVREHSLVR